MKFLISYGKRLLISKCFYFFVLLLVYGSNASASVITVCGGSSGFAFYLPGGAVPEKQSGWQEDHIKSGQIMFLFDEKGPDIILRDAQEITRSVKEDGAKVELIRAVSEQGIYFISVTYVGFGIMSNYLFKLDKSGKGQVVWSTTRGSGLINKIGVYHSECQK